MDDKQIEDLKQFIANTISNTVTDIVKTSERRLRRGLAGKKDLKAGFDGVADAIETLSEHVDKRLDDHETRITTLEKAASA